VQKKAKKILFLVLIFFIIFLFISFNLPLPQNVSEALLTAKINNFLPDCSIELKKSKFFLFKGLRAESVSIYRNKEAIFIIKEMKLSYSFPFMFTGKGKLKLTSSDLYIRKIPKNIKFLRFLSNILNYSFGEELTFESFLLDTNLHKREIILNNLEAIGDDLKVTASGYLKKNKEINFNIDLFFSDTLAQAISEDTKKFLFESQRDGFNKIGLKIYGLPAEPSFKIKTKLLELNIS
jgi:hypothetical protein